VCVVGGEAGRLLGEVLVSTMEWVEGVLDGTQNREEQGEASWGGRRCPLWLAPWMDGGGRWCLQQEAGMPAYEQRARVKNGWGEEKLLAARGNEW
jgi:hypothetical protein